MTRMFVHSLFLPCRRVYVLTISVEVIMSDSGRGAVVPCTTPRSMQPTALTLSTIWSPINSSALGIVDTRCLTVLESWRTVALTAGDVCVCVCSPTSAAYTVTLTINTLSHSMDKVSIVKEQKGTTVVNSQC